MQISPQSLSCVVSAVIESVASLHPSFPVTVFIYKVHIVLISTKLTTFIEAHFVALEWAENLDYAKIEQFVLH